MKTEIETAIETKIETGIETGIETETKKSSLIDNGIVLLIGKCRPISHQYLAKKALEAKLKLRKRILRQSATTAAVKQCPLDGSVPSG